MTIPLTGTGGFFTREGKQGKAVNNLNNYRGLTGTAGTDWTAIFGQFASADQIVIDQLWSQLVKLQGNMSAAAAYLQSVSQATLIQMAQDDQFLEDTSLYGAMQELIRQMKVNSQFVKQPVVSASVTTGNGYKSNKGNGVLLVTTLDNANVQLDYSFAETIIGKCTQDAQTVTNATSVGKEQFTFYGENAAPTQLDPTWPLGSGFTGLTENAVTPDDNSNQNTCLLQGGNWEAGNWTSNTPNYWTVGPGSPGTQVLKGATAFRGSNSLEIAGDGTTLTALTQSFNTPGQSTAKINPVTLYAFNCWLLVSSTPGAGVLEIALVDGSGNYLLDESGAQQKIAQNLTLLTGATWTQFGGFFRTPRALPVASGGGLGIVALRMKLTTALSNTINLFVDDTCLQTCFQFYPGGPFAALFSGSTPFVTSPLSGSSPFQGGQAFGPDEFMVTVSNDYSSAQQKMAERLFGMRNLGLILPSTSASGSVTISDSLLS